MLRHFDTEIDTPLVPVHQAEAVTESAPADGSFPTWDEDVEDDCPDPVLHHRTERFDLWHGDCLPALRGLPDASVDAIVTDPPYGLSNTDPGHVADTIVRWVGGDRSYLPGGAGFMGKAWDSFVPPPAVWDECLRVLKPGGHLLVFAGSRTIDLMTLGIRLAGFDIRDTIAWMYGSGFPKSMDVAKAIDKAVARRGTETAPEAARWQGWGTALKPAMEPIVVARKPLAGTVAANVLAHGTGALNIDATRVEAAGRPLREGDYKETDSAVYEGRMDGSLQGGSKAVGTTDQGRWPTNVVLSHTEGCVQVGVVEVRSDGHHPSSRGKGGHVGQDNLVDRRSVTETVEHWQCAEGCPVAELDTQSGTLSSGDGNKRRQSHQTTSMAGTLGMLDREEVSYGDSGGASRFFPSFKYQAKAPKKERPEVGGIKHPTVKPLALMDWLVRLVTPPDGVVLDPFLGSGTTAEAALRQGFRCIGIEREADYLPLVLARLGRIEAE